MEGTEETDNAIKNSEKDTGLLRTEPQNLNGCLKNLSDGDADDRQNIVRKIELNGTLSENKIVKETQNNLNDSSVLDDDFLVNVLARNSSSDADSSELRKNPEKVVQLEALCAGKVDSESTKTISDSSRQKEMFAPELATNDHQHNKATDATELISSSSECVINTNADAKEVSVPETQITNPTVQPNNGYRCDSDSWSDDDDDDSSSSDTSSDSDFFQMMIESSAPKKIPVVKTKGELGLDELPPIEDLVISVQEEEMTLIGKIHAVVDKLVVIRAIKDMKPLDLDSVLFLTCDKPLGRVFDVFGPVVEPFYCVRFNCTDDIDDKGVEIGSDVFFAPEKSDITAYVFVDELQRQKGSDASWRHNNEPPEEYLDFSDDEEEKAARRKRISRNRNRQINNGSDSASKRPSLAGDSSPQSNFRNYTHPAPPRNIYQAQSNQFPRHNPFSTPSLPPPSPSPSVCSIMSTPVRVKNSFSHFSTPNQPRLPFSDPRRPFPQNILQRSPSLLFTTYPQPPVFGQMALLSPMPSPLPLRSPVMNNIPTLIPASHLSPMTPPSNFSQRFPRNLSPLSQGSGNHIYLNQGFPRSPSPVSQNQRTTPDPWFSNRSPSSFHVPPNHPLTVQIPNQSNPSVTMHAFQPDNVPLQPFVNNNINFHNRNVQSRFY